MSTWSDKRESSPKSSAEDQAKGIADVKRFNGLLKQFVSDSYLQDFLKNPTVQAAIMHWTGVARLAPEIAKQFERNQHVMYVFQKMQLIAHEANKNPIANKVLMECMTGGIPELRPEHVFQLYGESVTMAVCGDALKAAATAKAKAETTVKAKTDKTAEKAKQSATSTAGGAGSSKTKGKASDSKSSGGDTDGDISGVDRRALLEKFTGSSTDSLGSADQDVPVPENPYPTVAPEAEAEAEAEVNESRQVAKGDGGLLDTLSQLSMWGHEDPNGPDWSLFRWLARILIDVLVYGAVGYWFALQFQHLIPDPSVLDTAEDAAAAAAGAAADSELPPRPEMNGNYEF